MTDYVSERARAESIFLTKHLRSTQEADRLASAEQAERAMEEKTARLRAMRVAREEAGAKAS